MAYIDRRPLIVAVEQAVGFPLLTYMTADRQTGLGAQIGADVTRLLKRHLDVFGQIEELGLYVYTRGGDTLVPLRVVSLMREYAERVTLIVPFRAHSAGTLLALGCDRILMHRMAELSPIDPSVANQFNPPNAQQAGTLVPISVEDVTAYLALVREKAQVTDPAGVSAALQALTSVVHPLALGNVQRSHLLIRRIARTLLGTHQGVDQNAIDKVVDVLTEKLYSHQYAFGRVEARTVVGLPVQDASPVVEAPIWTLYERYEADLLIGGNFDPVSAAQQPGGDFSTVVAAVETRVTSDEYEVRGRVTQVGPGIPPTIELQSQQWARRA